MSYGAIGSDERRTTSYSLDLYGNVLKETDNLGNSNLYEYDFLGNVTKSTDRNGVVTEYFYDGLSRITEQKNSKSGILKTSYNEFGEISEKSDGTLYTKYEYNKFGDIEKIIKNSTSELYEYDIDANITKHILDDKDMGKTEYLYKYNDKNLPIEIITPIGTEYITYDKAGRITLKENSQTGTQKKYSYFPDGNIKDILTSQSGETVYFENYSYDKNGNKVYENLNGIVSQYSYDGMSRLKRAIKNNIVTEYEFDGFNNISKEFEIADNKISKKQHFYDLNNRLILSEEQSNVIQYQYDNAGNLTKKSYFTGGKATDSYYRYDGYNRLSEFESNDTYSQYAYNPDGLREYKTVNGVKTRFMYNGADVAGELTDGNYYLYHRATELMGYTSFKGDTYYYRQDSHGNVTAILDITGNEIKSYSYNPYGKKETFSINPEGNNTILYQWKAETDKLHNPFGYCGEYTDNETGLIYLRNRYYDSNNGRFITEDPIKDGLNWYVYCGNNPIMFVDPSGLIITEWDEEHCTNEELKILKQNTKAWNNGNAQEKIKIAQSSRQIREKYLSDGEILLDNGYVEQKQTESVNINVLNDEINIVINISYIRTYTEKFKYLQLTKVVASINENENIIVNDAKITYGQTDIRGKSEIRTTSIRGSNTTFYPNWNKIVDDNGVYSIIGATVYVYAYKENSNEIHQISVTNNVYQKFVTIDNDYYEINELDIFDVLMEAMQRGERN